MSLPRLGSLVRSERNQGDVSPFQTGKVMLALERAGKREGFAFPGPSPGAHRS